MALWGIFSPLGVDISISNIRWDIAEKRMSTLCSNGDFLMFFELLTVSFVDKDGDPLPGVKANWKLSTDGQKVAVLLFINGEKAFGNEDIEIARICQIEGDGFPSETGDYVCNGKSDEGLLRVKILDPEIYRTYGCRHGGDRSHGAKHKLDKFKHITVILKDFLASISTK